MPDTPATLSQAVTIGVKVQSDEFTKATIINTDCVRNLAGEIPMPDIAFERFDRPITGEDLEREPGRTTRKMMTLTHTEQLGAQTAAAAPGFSTCLLVSGFQEETVSRIRIGAVTGTFEAGEVVTNGGGDAVVFLEVQSSGGNSYMVYSQLSGSPLAGDDALTGADSGATCTVTTAVSPEDAGFLYHPLSESTGTVPPSATVTHYRGGKEYTAIGARGAVKLKLTAGEPATAEFQLVGPIDLDSGSLPEGSPPASVPIAPNTAPLCSAAAMLIDGYTPEIMREFMLDTQAPVNLRPSIVASVGDTGYAPGRIRARDPRLTFDLEDVSDATHDVIGKAASGDAFAVTTAWGDWDAAGGRMALHCYSVQYDAPDIQDDENAMTNQVTAPVRKGPRVDWPFYLAAYVSPLVV